MSSSTPAVAKTLATDPNPEVRAFFSDLSPKDQLIHNLAVQMLKTRYTPQRSNAWAQWKKQQKK